MISKINKSKFINQKKIKLIRFETNIDGGRVKLQCFKSEMEKKQKKPIEEKYGGGVLYLDYEDFFK